MTRFHIAFPALPLAALLLAGCATPALAPADSESCSIHGVRLVGCEVEVQYGYGRPIQPSDAEHAAREQLFPYSLQAPQGGCVVGAKTAIVLHCPSCTARQSAWETARDLERLIRDADAPAPLESARTRP